MSASRPPSAPDLPIDVVLPDIARALSTSPNVVVEAPPGAGKTTRVPPLLAAQDWADGRIVLLEPRRVAARAAARRMAAEAGDEVGGVVGVTTREDRRTSARTRIEVVTEGVLLRRLHRDASLPGVAAVVLDEFHERSVDADLALAFCRQSQQVLREDLRMVVMSATLHGLGVADLLGAPTVHSDGRLHDVAVHHVPRDATADLAPDVATAIRGALDEHEGDVLTFLPGVREIDEVRRLLDGAPADVVVLHGRLPGRDQDAALSPGSRRRVVLATDIAESSVTVPGVRIVVDAGLSREPRLDPRTGLTRLVTTRASQASADQRAGRAGRLGPGVAIRLWSRADHVARDPQRRPAILQADLSDVVLQAAAWGSEVADLDLLDHPPAAGVTAATALLHRLGALDATGRITDHGRRLVDLPTHPRLGHMLVRAADLGPTALDTAAAIAAVLGDRDPVRPTRSRPDADIATRVEAIAGRRVAAEVRRDVLDRARRDARRLHRMVPVATGDDVEASPGTLLALAWPDRVAVPRSERGRFVLANGRGVRVDDTDHLAGAGMLVVADVDDRGRDGWIRLAGQTSLDDLRAAAPELLATTDVVTWDERANDVVAETRETVGDLVLERWPLADPDPADVHAALMDGIRSLGIGALPWDDASRSLRDRATFLRRHRHPDWPDLADEALLADLDAWLLPFLGPAHRRRGDLRRVPLLDALRARLGWQAAREVDETAPTHLPVPSGSNVRLDYADPDAPVLAVKLQEMFGATTTPRVAGVAVVIHLLSPARRPLQVTRDLESFWDTTYADVRAEMRGRYPKHPWPEDPRTAVATARTTRRRR